MWIPIRRQNLMDHTTEVSNQLEQGSKTVTNMKDKDLKDLSNFCQTSSSSAKNEKFLRKALGKASDSEESAADSADDGEASEDDKVAKEAPAKKKRIDLGTAVSDAYAKECSQLSDLTKQFEKVVSQCQESLKTYASYAGERDAATDAYQATREARMRACQAWSATNLASCPRLPGDATQVEQNGVESKPASLVQASKVGDAAPSETKPDGEQQAAEKEEHQEGNESPLMAGPVQAGPLKAVVGATPAQEDGEAKPGPAAALGDDGGQIACCMISLKLQRLVEFEGKTKMPVNDVSLLRCRNELDIDIQKVMHTTEADELETIKKFLAEPKSTCKQLLAGTKKAASKLQTHISNKLRSAERQQKKHSADQEKQVIADAKKSAKEAANRVRKPEVFPLFKEWDSVVALVGIKTVESPAAERSADSPWVLVDGAAVSRWKEEGKVQIALSNFAGQYKKDDATRRDGQAQLPLKIHEGLEETAELFKNMAEKITPKPVGRSAIFHGSAVLGGSWVFGYIPDLCCAGLMPYGLGAMRVLSMGELKLVMVGLKALAETYDEGDRKLADLRIRLLKMFAGDIRALMAKHVTVYTAIVEPNQVLYVPVGFLVAEHAQRGHLFTVCGRPLLPQRRRRSTTCVRSLSALARAGRQWPRQRNVLTSLEALAKPVP